MAATRIGGPIVETLLAFAIVFVLQSLAFVVGAIGLLNGLFVLAPPLAQNPWTIVTSVYAHQTLGHLFSNAVMLVIVGWPIVRATTRLRFHAFFVAMGALAGVSQIVLSGWLAAIPFVPVAPTPGVLGASGAVFALLGYLLAGNRLSAGVAGVVDAPRWLSVLVFLALATAVTLTTAAPGVALIAHFTGFMLGLLAGRFGVLRARSRPTADRSTA